MRNIFGKGALQMFKDEVNPTNHLQPWPIDFRAAQASDGTWTSARVKIAWEKSGSYSTADWAKIQNALTKIKTDTKNCIAFEQRSSAPDAPFWHAHPLRITTDSVLCKTFNGKYTGPTSPGTAGQIINIFGSNTLKGECLTQPRDTLRIIMNTLGIANDYQRPDRDNFLKVPVDPVTVAHPTLTGGSAPYLLGKNSHISTLDPFDVKSITMVDGSRFAREGESTFTQRDGSPIWGSSTTDLSQVKMSRMDCENLDSLYGCNIDCSSAVFLPSELVGPLKSLKPPKLFSNLNCWQAAGAFTQDDIGKGLGFLGNVQPEDSMIIPNKLTWSHTSTNGNFFVAGPPPPPSTSRDIAVFLREKKIEGMFGLDDKITITAVDATDNNREVINHDLGIELNCLPKFSFDGRALVCGGPSQGFGTNAVDCTVGAPTPLNTNPQSCQGGSVSTISLGPFMVSDPDFTVLPGSVPQFTSVSVFVGGAAQPSPNWVWISVPSPAALYGYVVKTDASTIPVSSAITVRLSVADISSALAALPNRRSPGKAAPVTKTLTASFRVTCATFRSPYTSLLWGANRFRV
ncbi:hypothetical protein RvY_12071-2 [Ramazzottius varieornatus]|uniref:Peptidase M12A domain-containing protein n=1 Tax=Ramazzottius varieornatus TaxID=947166 RepID=A0A1D1VMI2_RAMVA|nr:hypothetical protein RvY_12071-2 [Ramazzottius varieornatus]